MLMQDTNRDSNAFATPRSWVMVSNLFNHISNNLVDIFPMVVGCIGIEAANDFFEWHEIVRKTPSVEEIFKGVYKTVPKLPKMLFAISNEIVSYAREHHGEKGMNNAIKYVHLFPTEFRNKVYTELLRIKEIRPILQRNETFCSWFELTKHSWEYYK